MDYICLFCRKYPTATWNKFNEILKKYEYKREQVKNEVIKLSTIQQLGTEGKTQVIRKNLNEFANFNELEITEEKGNELIQYMCSLDNEFTRKRYLKKNDLEKPSGYNSGYSIERWQKFNKLLYYLWILYKGEEEDNEFKMMELSDAIRINKDWEFWDVKKEERHGSKKFKQDNMPFCRYVYYIFKGYSYGERLKAIKRLEKHPDHAAVIERKDALMIAYLFISGELYTGDNPDELEEEVKKEIKNTEKSNEKITASKFMKKIMNQLKEINSKQSETVKLNGKIKKRQKEIMNIKKVVSKIEEVNEIEEEINEIEEEIDRIEADIVLRVIDCINSFLDYFAF